MIKLKTLLAERLVAGRFDISSGFSDHLAHQHGGHGGEECDAEGGEGVLTLGHGNAGDNSGSNEIGRAHV